MSLTIESPSMTVPWSFMSSGVSLSVLSLDFCIFRIAVFLRLVSQFLYFSCRLGALQFHFRFLVSTGCIALDGLLVLDISGFAGICSCRVLFSVFITSLFIPFQLFWLVGVSNSVGSISCRFIN